MPRSTTPRSGKPRTKQPSRTQLEKLHFVFGGGPLMRSEFRLEIPAVKKGGAGAERILLQTHCGTIALAFLQLSFADRRKAIELLLKEIRASEDQTTRFVAGKGYSVNVVEQRWFDGTVVVVSSS